MQNKLKINKNNVNMKAFTIIETLVTLLAITIMIAGPLTFMSRSYQYAEFIKYKTIGMGLAQEGLELATSLRNADLNEFNNVVDSCQNGCMADWNGVSSIPTFTACIENSCRLLKSSSDTNILYRSIGDVETEFFRYVKFTPISDQSYGAESVVWANVNGIKVETILKKIIFNINIK
jgi:Tfp pilus assembly protein PilV